MSSGSGNGGHGIMSFVQYLGMEVVETPTYKTTGIC